MLQVSGRLQLVLVMALLLEKQTLSHHALAINGGANFIQKKETDKLTDPIIVQ